MRVYAIGDVHGQLGELERAHALIEADRARVGDREAPVVHVGDLCDRGPQTRGVIDFLLAGLGRGENWVVLMGNHDRLFAWFLEDPPRHDPHLIIGWSWLHENLGGIETLASYGVEVGPRERVKAVHARALAAIPPAHRRFVQGLPYHYEYGACLFVHAGIRPGVELADQSEEDLVWIRREFLDDPREHGWLVVHGHTPVEAVTHYGNRLNIDTGAGWGKPLSAVVIEGRAAWVLTEAGRVKVVPV